MVMDQPDAERQTDLKESEAAEITRLVAIH
jgi:hypothetical protein